jgi:hypothetical protein
MNCPILERPPTARRELFAPGAARPHASSTARRRFAAAAALGAVLLLAPLTGAAAPVAMRYPEGPAHGFITLSDAATKKTLAHGELIQSIAKRAVVSRLVIRFDDGSLYDETVRFAQRPVFRVLSYHLTQKGPSFPDDTEVEFARSGSYRARKKERGKPEERDAGTTDIPEDVSNGLTSVLLKNLPHGASAATHLMTFDPKPLVLDLELAPEGTDTYWVGGASSDATRFLVKPTVPGVKGVLASAVGKQPPQVRMWIAPEPAPSLVRFEGALFIDGPQWRVDLATPRWKR